ncbi:MAG: SDR family oxidoreductase [Bacillota bacterium]|nr:SDR family oxidoreductase [Bacillota bacterium]
MAYNPKDPAVEIMRGYVNDTKGCPLEDMFFVKGKVALVTGGTSGLGFNVALRLLQGGARVVVAGYSEQEAENALGLFEECGFRDSAVYCKVDVRNEDEVENMVRFVDQTYGTLDILVTAAATWNYAHIYDLPDAEFKKVVDVNLSGAFRTVKHVSRYMIDHEIHGKMTLVSSNCAWLPYPVFGGYAHYAASKGGVIALTVEAAKELKRYGIKVNTVAPGGMATAGSMNNLVLSTLPEEKQDELYEEISIPQLDEVKTVDSVARVVYSLCTDLTDSITGECIAADNGMSHNIIVRQPEIEGYPAE